MVRAQLAASARRWPAAAALPILESIWLQDRDRSDPHIPLLLWWALESKAISDRDTVLRLFARAEAWQSSLRRDDLRRLIRRYAAEGAEDSYAAAARLLAATPSAHGDSMLAALDQGLAERAGSSAAADTGVFHRFAEENAPASALRRSFQPVAGALRAAIEKTWRAQPADPLRTRLALHAVIPAAREAAVIFALNRQNPPAARSALLNSLAEAEGNLAVRRLLPLLEGDEPDDVRVAALAVLSRSSDAVVATTLISRLSAFSPAIRDRGFDLLFSRSASALALLKAVERGVLPPLTVPAAKLRRVAALKDSRLDALVRKQFGNIGAGTPEEKLAVVRRLSNDIRAASGDPKSGQRLFVQHCGSCHKLFGAGGDLGMDLTDANRRDRFYMLTHIVDPSVFIRKEYMTVEVRTRDGRLLTGLLPEEDAAAITLMDANYRRTRIIRADILLQEDSSVSLMPEGILERLTPQQLRDLFAYLESAP